MSGVETVLVVVDWASKKGGDVTKTSEVDDRVDDVSVDDGVLELIESSLL